MSSTAVITLTAVVVVVLGVSVATRPRHSSTVDFYLAGQRVGVLTNSWAICGDYLSAASFLGVAAAVYVSGLDGAWYAVGFAAGIDRVNADRAADHITPEMHGLRPLDDLDTLDVEEIDDGVVGAR